MSWRSPPRGGSGRNEACAVDATCRLLLLPQGSPPPRRNPATALQLLSMVQNSWTNVPSLRRGLNALKSCPSAAFPTPLRHPVIPAQLLYVLAASCSTSQAPIGLPSQHRAHREVEA